LLQRLLTHLETALAELESAWADRRSLLQRLLTHLETALAELKSAWG
jgi:hypothetical protein